MDTTIPTTYAHLTAAGWISGSGLTGCRFRSIVIGGYEIMVHTDGGGVSLECCDGAIQFSEDDTVALATKIAALLRGEPAADLAKAEARITEAHAALDEAGAPACDGVLSERITALAADLDQSNRSLGSAMWDRDTLRAEVETLRARLAERPTPLDHRDQPVNTAAEEAIERLWGTLYALGGDLNRADFADGIEGIADAVEAALSLNLEQIRALTEERDHAGRLAMEQFRCRLYRT